MFTDGKCDEALEPLATLTTTTAAYSALQSSNAIRIDSDVSDRWKNPRSSHTGVVTYKYDSYFLRILRYLKFGYDIVF